MSDTRIVLAVDPSDSSTNEDLRIVKLANSVTYDRLIHPAVAWKAGSWHFDVGWKKALNQPERTVLPASEVVSVGA